MKQLYAHLLASALGIAVGAQGMSALEWNLQGKTFSVDTTYHATIGPGITHTTLSLSGAAKLRIFYSTTDLENPYADVRATKGSNALNGLAVLSKQHANADRPGARYLAGINADFFGGNRPCGSVVVDNQTIYAINNGWDSFYMLSDGKAALGRLIFSGTASSGTASCAITGINIDRGENALVVYNKFRGASTGTNAYGSELRLEVLEGTVGYRGHVRCRVVSAPDRTPLSIGTNDIILSGHGTSEAFVTGLSIGDEVELDFNSTTPDNADVTQLAGGLPVILSGGEVQNTQDALDHLVSNHPRSAVGYDASRTKVVLLVVDGRTNSSVGVTSRQLADIMRYLGCTEALNFDGGGSSEFYTSQFGIRNHPSDGNERAVVDAMWSVSTAPDDDEVASIAFEYHSTFGMPRYGYLTPRVYGYNKYGALVDSDFKGYTLSCPEELGKIVDGGLTLFGNGSGCHPVVATYGDCKATMVVEISNEQPHFLAESVLIDAQHPYAVEVGADVNGEVMKLENSALSWQSSDNAIASVDENGIVRGLTEGTTVISGAIDSFSGDLTVNVEIPAARYLPLNEGQEWTVTSSGMNTVSVVTDAANETHVDYNVKNNRSAQFTLRHDHNLRALPDSLRLVVSAKPDLIRDLVVTLKPAAERNVTYTLNVEESGEPFIINIPLSDLFDTSNIYNYPIAFTSLKFNLKPTVGVDNTITVHRADAVYSYMPEPSGVEDIEAEGNILKLKNNCIKAGEAAEFIGYNGAWMLYNVSGAVAATGEGASVDTANLMPGLYIVRANSMAAKLIVY
ncbi:MAG: phosphodiester glycosidase family protein [Muribaculaceae bacterium]|nr:phosphodiester glycosidase family protein [Muribaculaceae bacterium]